MDTGSIDRTVEIAKKYTDHVYFKKFNNDYGMMRNHLLEKIDNEDWILFLDADEYFTVQNVNKLKKYMNSIKPQDAGIRFYRYNFYSKGGWYTDHIVKMFRNNQGFTIVEPNITLNHMGKSKPRHIRENLTKKYVDLMKQEVMKNPSDGLMHAYVGINSMALGDFDIAEKEGKIGVRLSPDSPRAYYFYGTILRSVNKNIEALDVFLQALTVDNGNMKASFMNMIGITYLTLQKLDIAKKYFEEAYSMNSALIHVLINLGLTYYFQMDYENALFYFEKVALENEGFLTQSIDGILEYDPFTVCSYETIHNYMGLESYICICKQKMQIAMENIHEK